MEQVATDVSPKSRLATSLLAIFLGWVGAHRFYMGKMGTAVVMLAIGVVGLACVYGPMIAAWVACADDPQWGIIMIGGMLLFAVRVWALVDFIIALTGNCRDSQGRIISKW